MKSRIWYIEIWDSTGASLGEVVKFRSRIPRWAMHHLFRIIVLQIWFKGPEYIGSVTLWTTDSPATDAAQLVYEIPLFEARNDNKRANRETETA